MNGYKSTVARIKSLNWEGLSVTDLQSVMVLSNYSAREFGDSLRIALQLNPSSHALKELAAGELDTDNL